MAPLVYRRRPTLDLQLPGIARGLVAAMAHNLVDYSWSVTGTALPFWALLGAAVALTPGADKVNVQQEDAETRRGQDGTTGRRGDGARSEHLNTGTLEHPNARTPERLNAWTPGRLALGAAGVLLLGWNAIWLGAAEHQARAQAASAAADGVGAGGGG